jgi:hypothetical protein
VVRNLLDNGAGVESKCCYGRTPEDEATARSHLPTASMLKAEALRRAKCAAFAMGHQERLGAWSRVRGLDAEMLRMLDLERE